MRAVVLGNIAMDESFVTGSLPVPGASVPMRRTTTGPGGKGANQAVALARALGSGVRLVAVLGDDARGQDLARMLAPEPLDLALIRRAGLASDLSVILRDDAGENIVLTTQAAAHSMTPDEARAALQDAGPGDVLLMQGNLSPATTEAALRIAGAQGMTRVLNPSPVAGVTAAHLALADLIVLNGTEAAWFGADLPQDAWIVRTMGAGGASLSRGGETLFTVPATPADPVDSSGAGDCFLGAMVASMIRRGATVPAAADLEFAARAAAITVARAGTQAAFPTAAEFARL